MNMNLRVLLVEGEPEEAIFLKDVLKEIEEGRCCRPWVGTDVLHAETCEDAETILATEPLDVVLLNPDLPDRQGFPAFRRLQAVAPSVPVVVLLGLDDDALGLRLVREGAQDFLLRKQVDCEPLAHALRNAVERQKPTTASEASRLRDTLTGLATVGCFAMFAERDRKLAEQFGCRWMVILAEPRAAEALTDTYSEQRRDLRLVETADLLRQITAPGDALYRIGTARFALTRFENRQEKLESSIEALARLIPRERVMTGVAIFDPQHPVGLESLLEDAREDLTTPTFDRNGKPADVSRSAGAA
jgi:PleD family two-component response regulator